MPDLLALAPDIPLVVLDTNIVLDWLVFRDARVAALAAMLNEKRARWLATPTMRQEFEHVLARQPIQCWSPDLPLVVDAWARHAHMQTPPAAAAPWQCKDRSDQIFVDLAVATRAQALLTRDRKLLALARRASSSGLAICVPEQWVPHA